MESNPFKIRRGEPADAAILAEFGARLYETTFGAGNTTENMVDYLSKTYGMRQQTDELTSLDIISLLVEVDRTLIGYAQVRRNSTTPDCIREAAPVELYRFYIDTPYQGRGIAPRLMKEVRHAAAELGGRTLWLSVWELNPRAVAFYARSGFKDVGSTDFWMGNERQTDRVMAAEVS